MRTNEDVLALIKHLEHSGYDAVSLPELKFHYQRTFGVNIELPQLSKAVAMAGYKIDGDLAKITRPVLAPHFSKLPRTKFSEVLK